MNANDPNVILLETVAERLGEALREELIFVGGAVAGLLITDPAMPAIRPTDDVDLVTHAAALKDFHAIERKLAARGFVNDMRPGAPICRWRMGDVAVDVMPTNESILGFSNRWYPFAVETAEPMALPSGVGIRLIFPPVFIATKLEAFAGRGNNDFLFSHDMGDLIAVMDGRESLVAECQASDNKLRSYLRAKFSELMNSPSFMQALPGHLPGDAASQARLPDLENKLRTLANLT
jgi:predicted nucleotidyltransferase